MTAPEFLFATCQVGAEAALKKEVARDRPDLRPSFSRPGFMTFKWAGPAGGLKDAAFHAVFARTHGLSVGKAKGSAEDLARAAIAKATELGTGPWRLHVWERDQYAPGQEPKGFVHGHWSSPVAQALKALRPTIFHADPVAQSGDSVFDVILVEPGEAWFGTHVHGPGRLPFAGGIPQIDLPPEAPSRAYLKLEEAILWSGAPLREGDIAVDIGSAPGGASYALLQRGLNVVGIDPAEMDPRVLRHPRFTHFREQVNGVLRERLPEQVHWILLDMNVAPSTTMFSVDRLVARVPESLLGVLLTVKLNDWRKASEIPSMIEHVRAMGERSGMTKIRATQLYNNRQEIFIYGLTRKGHTRTARKGAVRARDSRA